jgi:large subunit ribosomal protein L23
MELSRVIIGPVVTEKAERLKAGDKTHVYTLWVSPDCTKIEVRKALERFYDVSVSSVRAMRTQAKTRALGAGKMMEKRHAGKKVLVTLTPKSKALDLAAFQVQSS